MCLTIFGGGPERGHGGFPGAGLIQIGFDALVFLVAVFLFPAAIVGWSLVGAAALNILITLNHRRDRYIAR